MASAHARLALAVAAPMASSHAQQLHSSAHYCCKDRHLRIGMFAFTYQPYVYYDAAASPKWSGYLPDKIEMVAAELGFTYDMVEIYYPDVTLADSDGTYVGWDPAKSGVLQGRSEAPLQSSLNGHAYSSVFLPRRTHGYGAGRRRSRPSLAQPGQADGGRTGYKSRRHHETTHARSHARTHARRSSTRAPSCK